MEESMSKNIYDVIILGSGPAGLQAAIHAARARTSVLVLGKTSKSSIQRAHIENYCCMERVAGEDLLQVGMQQAEQSGTEFLSEDVIKLSQKDQFFDVHIESGEELRCRALIMAMGISRNKLRVPGEKELLGRGVSYCVDCDAGFFREEPVAIVGNESAAASGALTMLFYASQVHLVCDKLDVTGPLSHQIRQSAIHLHESRKVKEILGENKVEGLLLDDGSRLDIQGVFIELGAKGAIELASELGVAMDSESPRFIATNKKQETNIPGVYAAGDICGLPWQIAKAVGEGCVAGIEASAYAKKFR
jgi:thioredoxin reductase (NADPH)